MTTLFLACAGLGAAVLIIQIALSVFGLDHAHGSFDGHVHAGGAGLAEGMELLSVRSIAAGTAFFGLGGLGALSIGVPALVAAAVALLAGGTALVATAYLAHQMLRLESSGSLEIRGAVGVPATVYLTIPGGQQGPGKVHLALQGRTVELQAVTPAAAALPTGTSVVVVSVVNSDTVEVVPTSIVEEVLDDNR